MRVAASMLLPNGVPADHLALMSSASRVYGTSWPVLKGTTMAPTNSLNPGGPAGFPIGGGLGGFGGPGGLGGVLGTSGVVVEAMAAGGAAVQPQVSSLWW